MAACRWGGKVKIHDEMSYVSSIAHHHKAIYLSTTTKFRQTHITLIREVSRQLSGMAVCTPVSLAVAAHELSFPFALPPLGTHILINIGGIDIYYLKQNEST